jgi:hypothetical protein
LIAWLAASSQALAQANDQYDLVWSLKSENGQQFDMPLPGGDFSECYRQAKKTKIGTVIPSGVLISPNGKSYAATVVGAKCVVNKKRSGTGD